VKVTWAKPRDPPLPSPPSPPTTTTDAGLLCERVRTRVHASRYLSIVARYTHSYCIVYSTPPTLLLRCYLLSASPWVNQSVAHRRRRTDFHTYMHTTLLSARPPLAQHRSHGHTHTPTENNTPDPPTHDKNNTPHPQTNTPHKHLLTQCMHSHTCVHVHTYTLRVFSLRAPRPRLPRREQQTVLVP